RPGRHRTARPRGRRVARCARLRAEHLGHGHPSGRRRPARRRIVDQQGVLVRVGRGHPRDRTRDPRRRGRGDGSLGRRVPVLAVGTDLRRHQRDPEERHRRATPRPTEGGPMRFTLDTDHLDFAASVDALLGKADLPAVIRAWNTGDTAPGLAVWSQLAETGVSALGIAESHGGIGDPIALAVAAEQLGRHAVPGPIAETLAVAPTLLAAVAPDRLEALAEGALATVAAAPITPYAVDADVADTVLALDADTVSLATPGEQHVSVDPARKLFTAVAGEALGTVDDAQRGAAED